MRFFFVIFSIFLLQGCASSSSLTAKLDKKSEAYLAFRDHGRVSLSKKGSYLAVTSIKDNKGIIAIYDRKTMKMITTLPMEEHMKVRQFVWVSDTRVLIQVVVSEGYLNGRGGEGFLFAIDYDGKNKKQLFPQRVKNGASVNLEFKGFSILSEDLIDDKFLLISENTSRISKGQVDLKLLNIVNGRTKLYDSVKMENGSYVLDNNKVGRIAYKTNKKLKTLFYTKNLKTKKWAKNNFWTDKVRDIQFLGFAKNNSTFYFLGDNKKTLKALYSAKLSQEGKVSNIKEIFSYSKGDILTARWDKKAAKVLFVEYGDGRPQRKYFSSSPYAQLLKNLDKAFPGERVYMGKKRGDENLLRIRSDKRPTTYYIYNHKNKGVNELLSTNEAVRSYPKIGSSVVRYKTRDGLNVRGYLYKKKSKTRKIAPMIMYIHGGPYGIYDTWDYNGDIQYMASRGYSVMQINYRGSGSRGRDFEEKGYKRLGTNMQEDLADAALWAVKNKHAEKGNICLWGISYGAYASLMSIHKYPDLFECAVGFGGVYDWRTIVEQGDGAKNAYAKKHWEKTMPDTKEEQFKQSPISLTKDLKKEVYVMHGQDDVRCHVLQARTMKSALEENNKKFKYREYPGIGHWFASKQGMKNHAYNEVVNFFDSKLKK